jgi:hypothetical protein
MRRRNIKAAAGDDVGGDDSQPVMVPRNVRPLVATSSERARRLRGHLVATLRALRTMKDRGLSASPVESDRVGFEAVVAHAACGLCKGWCCKGGGEHAYVDEATIARVRRERPELNALAVARLYSERVPTVGYEGSCIFHGRQGCTLDRSLRSDVCNSYFCGGLDIYLTGGDPAIPVIIISGEGNKMITSRVLTP